MLRYAGRFVCQGTRDLLVCHLWREGPNRSRGKKNKRREKKEGARGAPYMRNASPLLVYAGTLTTRQLISRSRDGLPGRASDDDKREGCCCNAIARQMCTVSGKTLSWSPCEFTRFERRRNHVRYPAVFNRVAESSEERVEP